MNDFETILDRFEKRRSRNSSPGTVNKYVTHVRSWREWLSETRSKTLWSADTIDLRVFVEERADDGLAPASIKQRTSAISNFYQDCDKLAERYDMPEVPENPYEGLDKTDRKLLRGDTKKKKALKETGSDEYPYLEREKVAELVSNVPAPQLRNELIIKMLFNCGFRRGELANLKLKNIDREDRSVYIPPQKSPEGRSVAYSEDYLGFQLAQWLDYGGRDSMTYAADSDYFFPSNSAEHISGNNINRIVTKSAESAGLQEVISSYSDGRDIRKVTAHTLRHSFAMAQLKAGVNVRTLQTLLGHSDLETTLIYLQQSTEEAKEESRTFQPGV